MSLLFFGVAVVIIIGLCTVGAVVASVIVAQNWRIIVYVAVAMVLTAGLAAACHMARGV